MLPPPPEEKGKKRRKQPSVSTPGDTSRSSTSSAKAKARRKIPSARSQSGTAALPGVSSVQQERRISAADSYPGAGTNETARSERGQSLQAEEQRKAVDATVLQNSTTNSGLSEPTVSAPEPASLSKPTATSDYEPQGLSAGQGNLQELRREHLPPPAAMDESTGGTSHRGTIKNDTSPLPLPHDQLAETELRKAACQSDAHLSKSSASVGDVGSKVSTSNLSPSNRSPGHVVKLAVPEPAEQDLSSKACDPRRPPERHDPKLHRRPSLSAFLCRLQVLGKEHGGEQRVRKYSSEGFECDGRRVSELMLTVAGVPITKRQVLVMIVFVFLITVAAIAFVILFARDKRSSPSQPLCQTDDCFHHSYRLFANLNRSLNPCKDFSAYVCSAWSPPQGYLQHSNSAMDDVRKSWFPKFHDMLRRGSNTIHAGVKPLAMYTSCMGNRKEYGSNVDVFWNFLHECKLSWPQQPETGRASPLEVLMSLAFKWQVPLFFQVRAMRMIPTPNWRIIMAPGSLIPLMYQHHLTVKKSGGYDKYWATFYFILSGKHDGSAVNKTAIDSVAEMEGDVFKTLLTSMRPPVVRPVLVTIAEIGAHTPPLASEQWLHAFRQTMLEPEVKPSDQVLLSDVDFFRSLAGVMTSYKDAELLSLIAWSFVQLFSPAVDYRLLENRYDRGVTMYRPYFCERFVETAYRFLVVALGSVALFSREERAVVNARFDSLVSAAVDMVKTLEWLDAESRQLVVEKLSSTRLHLWPPEKFLQNDVLERVYESFPSAEPSFAEYWVKTSRCSAETYRPRPDIDMLSYPINYALPYLSYDAASSSVKVAVGSVTEPLYYPGGTKAMSYGGLGFSMALQLVAALDRQGIRWHPNGVLGGSFLSNASTRAFEVRDGCPASTHMAVGGNANGTGRVTSVFPEIPALEVAYAAYRRSFADSGEEVPQGIPGGLSADQVFFMTMCYMTCTLPGAVGTQAVDCNKAVRNSEAFAQAFHCTPGSPMNPKKKCTFFT
ncbi:hypothetical protein HPB50_002429 [Hyalomma asiaticum]|uniref:Uncharacterized protein n=1 Tax=Hyalomma asiaticum TaxID=266040 RepID=A0ACB7SBK4_HYAAI|nr:hypothetical protein HPB50_002429 [Hyalomma asiaticum]